MGFFAVGIVAGILSGFFGIGGGLVIVPALMMIWHMQPQAATGTSLRRSLCSPSACSAHGNTIATASSTSARLAFIAFGLLFGGLLGATIALELPSRIVQRAFAVCLVLAAVRLWWTAS